MWPPSWNSRTDEDAAQHRRLTITASCKMMQIAANSVVFAVPALYQH
jgi:hypothetical protein